ncbi:unnamed protein product [Candida verbasci]|uniref:Ribosomal protein S8 n=1 Tax=Candida verbasci TaxID=1227364 RepID=A0A9W4XFE1_9ASCO|nr:unnamed protein product [Candida verbasci]
MSSASLIQLANLTAHIRNCINITLSKTALNYNKTNLQALLSLYQQGFISNIQNGSNTGPDIINTPVTPLNISSRKLWIDLKYRNNSSVIRKISLISTPNRKYDLTSSEIKNLASGNKQVRRIEPLQPSECIFIENGGEFYEIQDAAKKGLDGRALFRVK